MESFEEFMKTRALEDLRENLKDPETLSMLEEIIKNRLNIENIVTGKQIGRAHV